MLKYYRDNPGRRSELLVVVILFALAGLFLSVGLYRQELVSKDALVYESICRQISRNTTEGRQAVVSSAWRPPLSILLRWPVAALLPLRGTPFASVLVSSLFGAACILLLERALRKWRVAGFRYAVVLAFALNPFFLRECVSGSASTTALFFALFVAWSFVQWVATRSLRSLVHLGFAAAGLLLTSFEMSLWLLVVILALTVDVVLYARKPGQREAALILALLPSLYALGLWILMNWLVMGNGLYFLGSLLSFRACPAGDPAGLMQVAPWHLLSAGLSAVCVVLFLLRRMRGGLYAGLLGVVPLAVAVVLRRGGVLWEGGPVLLSLFPLSILALFAAGARPSEKAPRLRWCAWIAPVIVSLASVVWLDGDALLPPREPSYASALADREALPHRIRQYVLARSRFTRVFVGGYDSFALLSGDDPDDIFVHALDFDFNSAKDAYPGQVLFLLVRRPSARDVTDSIHWKHDGLFQLGSRTALYDTDWEDWRLFEIIQAPEREP
jgi:hypothetical protein